MAHSGWLIFQCAEGQMHPLFIQPLDFTHAVREPGIIPWRGYQTTVNSGPPWAAQAAVGVQSELLVLQSMHPSFFVNKGTCISPWGTLSP